MAGTMRSAVLALGLAFGSAFGSAFGPAAGAAGAEEPCEIVRLGDLPGGEFASVAIDVSADGATVVGQGWSGSGTEAFRWTAENGMQGLGDLPGGDFASVANAVSADGTRVVGSATAAGDEFDTLLPVRWDGDGGPIPLELVDAHSHGEARDVSGDGSRVVGVLYENLASAPFEWSEAGGMALLDVAGEALAVSEDGSTVGGCREPESIVRAALWPPRSDPEQTPLGCVTALSADGAAAAGNRYIADPLSAFVILGWRWDGVGDDQPLTATPPDDYTPHAVSADGSVIVGTIGLSFPTWGFRWTEADGLRLLDAILDEDCGLDLGGESISRLNGVSADGRTLVGQIRGEEGEQAVRVRVPEAGGGAAALAALVALALGVRRAGPR